MAPRGQNGGANQYGNQSLLTQFPHLPVLIQEYLNDNVLQRDMPKILLRQHKITIGIRSIESIIKKYELKTARRPRMDSVQQAVEVLKLTEKDPLGRWGCRLVKEKLAADGIHITRDYIMELRRYDNPDAVSARHPVTRKKHHSSIWSVGPNEEWGLDGHEKILNSMGIAIWGIIDKYSRVELALWAVSNARDADVPRMLYLRLVLEKGGMPITTTADKGSELSKLIPIVTSLRKAHQEFLEEEMLPAHRSVKSIYNITRERSWRPLWEKELGNIKHEYLTGKIAAGFLEGVYVHQVISKWLWGAIVQHTLNKYRRENEVHRVRFQEKSLLPTGGRRIDFYNYPQDFNGEDVLIKIPKSKILSLIAKHDKPELLQFGTDEEVSLCEGLYHAIGSPELEHNHGWKIFRKMVAKYVQIVEEDTEIE